MEQSVSANFKIFFLVVVVVVIVVVVIYFQRNLGSCPLDILNGQGHK